MNSTERTEHEKALRLKDAYPGQAARMLCALQRSARTTKDAEFFAQSIVCNPQLASRVSIIRGCFISD
jgi:hypothetical protein